MLLLTRTEKHALLILCAVVLSLAVVHLGVMVFFPDGGAVPYTAEVPDGSRVLHTGIVENLSLTRTGGHLLINLSGTQVFVPDGGTKLTLLKGDRITVIGTAETYAGKREVVVDTLSDIRMH